MACCFHKSSNFSKVGDLREKLSLLEAEENSLGGNTGANLEQQIIKIRGEDLKYENRVEEWCSSLESESENFLAGTMFDER